MLKWKKGELAALLYGGGQKKLPCYYLDKGPLAVAKVDDRWWGILITDLGCRFPQRFKTKANAQEAAAILMEQGGLNFDFPTLAEFIADAGGEAAFRDLCETLIGSTY